MGGLLNPFTFHTIYDTVGRIKKFIDSANRETIYAYDDANRTNTVTNAQLETTTIKYDQRFQTIEVKDALNQVYNFSYDALGRQLTQTRAGAAMSYEYDAVGNRTKRTDYAGRITNYEYDNLNRLKKIIYGEVSSNTPPNLEAIYSYDDISRLKTAANEAGTVTLNYDNRNRITSTIDVFGHTVAYEYELTSTANQKRLKFDGAMYAVYNFDDADRLSNIVDSNDGTQINFGYDNADRLTSKVLPNGVTMTYEYDGMSRLKRLKDVSSTATLFDRQYAYNAASQINQIVEPTNTRTFGYDSTDRLKTVTASNNQNENYNYNDVGNRTSSHKSASYTYQTGQFNRLVSTSSANYNYDANGNLATKSEGSNFWRFTWDYENRLVSASTRKETISYRYDALGRRVQRYFRGTKENTKFIYDGQDVLVDDNFGVLTKYQNGLGIDDKLKVSSNSVAKYFLADHLGSTNALTDASGAILEQTAYDSFGNAVNNLSTRYQFTGREFDNFTGLHYYRARFYDSQVGRFISEDPIGFAGGDINLYGYVWNNPQQFTDPLGLSGGWGSDFADSMDERIDYARDWWKGDPQHWVWNGSVDTAADLAAGFADMFRVGNGLGYALYCEDNGYGKAAAIAMDVGRAAGIAGVILGGTAGRVPGGRPFNPFKGKTPQQIEGMFLGKGYIPKGPDPLNGRGTYMNPRSGRGYHIDAKHPPPKGPHVGVHRPRGLRKNRKARDFSL